MRLGIAKAIVTTLGFGLRHFVAFFVLGLLGGLPTYLHSFLPRESMGIQPGPNWPSELEFPESLRNFTAPRPRWETDFAIPMIETLLFCIAVAVAAQTLLGDRRGKDWAVFSGLGNVFRRAPAILGVGMVLAVTTSIAQVVMEAVPLAAFLIAPLAVFAGLVFFVAVPCAAVENAGTIYCFERSAELTSGSRWRILGVFILSILPLFAGIFGLALVLQYGLDLDGFEISPLMTLLANALGSVYFVPLFAVIHEALVALREGPGTQVRAKVFD